ncbi:hypothetical protein [Aphanizomenon sp. CS-733/32]|uniref:hypothetical protein n=1 Tax=Aphanizomenon sp. CS-733/32 TaxID=3021715 RepID=UPI00232E0156|nr:hypothetical protein [Aphanizomenon sp. CS-733/32]
MGVIYIGDRATGKTHLALELVNPKGEYVKVANLDYDNLRVQLLDENSQPYATSRQMYERYLEMEVRLHIIGPQASGKTTYLAALAYQP